jgi:serine/threonine-protein kinase
MPTETPADAQVYFDRGLEKLQAGNWKDALADFDQAIRLRPDVSIGYRFRAYAHADAGNVARALSDLDQAIRLKPDDVQCYYDRGQHLFRQKQYDEALADCTKGLGLDGARADLLGLRGRIHAARGDSERAQADFAKAIEIDPEGAADYLTWRGDLLMELEQTERALADYNGAIARDPDNPHVYSQRARAHWALRSLDDALADFSKAIELDPDWIWVRNGRGLVLADRGDHEAAVAEFTEAIGIDPKSAASYEYRAMSLSKLDRHAEAVADLNEAIRLEPDEPRLLNRRAMVHYFNREYGKAVRDHVQALKLDPNDAATFNYLAWIWCTAPDPNVRNGRRALECATRACELTEFQNAGFLDTLACAHAEMGNFTEAVKWAGDAVELAADDTSREEYGDKITLFEARKPYRTA